MGEYHDKGRIAMLGKAVGALNSCRSTGKLRSEHLLHLRCEVADPRMQDLFFPLSDTPALSLVSLMDHTPGQRQWRDTSSYRTYYSNIRAGRRAPSDRARRLRGGQCRVHHGFLQGTGPADGESRRHACGTR